MISASKGAIVVTGNASALRGKPSFAGVAPTKAAQPRRIGDGDDLRGAAVLFECDAGKHITGPDPCGRRRSYRVLDLPKNQRDRVQLGA